jgi:hypothetical protein
MGIILSYILPCIVIANEKEKISIKESYKNWFYNLLAKKIRI